MKRRTLSLLLALALCLGLTVAPTHAAEADENGFVIENGVLTQYVGNETEITIPSTVTAIGERGLANSNGWYLVSVTIPNTVTDIGAYAFQGLEDLTTVTFEPGGSAPLVIGNYAFSRCEKLTDVTIPARMTEMGTDVFSMCSNLETLTFEAGSQLKTINSRLLSGTKVTTLEIPASVETIGQDAFSGNIADSAPALTTVTFEAGSQLKTIEKYAFRFAPITEIEIPASVESIDGAFYQCSDLAQVTFAENTVLTSIGDSTFMNCPSLTEISFENLPNLTTIGKGAFQGSGLTEVTIPATVEVLDDRAFTTQSLSKVTFAPNSALTTIGEACFSLCALTEIALPAALTSIGDNAFPPLSLSTVTVAEGNTAFSVVDGVLFSADPYTILHYPYDKTDEEYTVPEGVTTTSTRVFAYNQNLKVLHLPSTLENFDVTTVGGNLTVTVAEGNPYFCVDGRAMFGLTDGVKTKLVRYFADYAQDAGTTYTVPETVKEIGDYAFTTVSLSGLVLPDGLTAIGTSAFRNMRELTSLVIPEGVTELKQSAISLCSKLTDLTLPSTLTTIGMDVFDGSSALTEVTVPAKVATIDNRAFRDCTALKKVTLLSAETAPTLSAQNNPIFQNCTDVVVCAPKGSPFEAYCAKFDNVTFQATSDVEPTPTPSTKPTESPKPTESAKPTESPKPTETPKPELVKTTVTVKQADGVYGQPLPAPSAKAEKTDGTGNGEWSYTYRENNGATFGTESAKAPTDAGMYTITATYTDSKYTGSGSANFTIQRAPIDAPKALSFTLPQNDISSKNTFKVASNLPSDRGDTTFTVKVASDPYSILKDTQLVEISKDGVLTCSLRDDAEVGESFTLTITADMGNYSVVDGGFATYTVTVTIAERRVASDNVPTTGGSTSTTTKNPDGSTTKTVTNKRTGTVTETTTAPDGTKTVVETTKDGTVTQTVTDPKGGKVTAVTKTDNTATITLSGGKKQAVVELPIEADMGTVAVIVNADGTETILKTTVPTQEGVKLLVDKNVTVTFKDNAKVFTDTASTAWAKDAIDFVSARGIFKGTSESTFTPDQDVDRAMMATLLYRLADGKAEGDVSFPDVEKDTWYTDAAVWANANGIVTGYDSGLFAPTDVVTREQMAVMFYRYAKLLELDTTAKGDLGKYTDMSASSDWAVEAMTWCVEAGLMNGTSETTLSPNASASRAEVATILMRMVQLMVK